MAININTWKMGEELACKFLKAKRYKILLRNDTLAGSEADIVAICPKKVEIEKLKEQLKANQISKQSFLAAKKQAQDILVFVEVKARTSRAFGEPQEAVNLQKQMHIVRYAKAFVKKHNLADMPARFDVVAVVLDGSQHNTEIEHIENAFL